MKKIIIAAKSDNNVIGKSNQLIWHMPADLKFFKATTKGNHVIMGRKTFESIGGKPLPGRPTVVITRDKNYTSETSWVVNSIDAAFDLLADKGIEQVFILGGAQIYDKTINIADKLIISEIHTAADGDAFFPTIDKTIWSEVSREDHKADEHNKYDYSFVVYEKTKKN